MKVFFAIIQNTGNKSKIKHPWAGEWKPKVNTIVLFYSRRSLSVFSAFSGFILFCSLFHSSFLSQHDTIFPNYSPLPFQVTKTSDLSVSPHIQVL
jgi:hypothetical protein